MTHHTPVVFTDGNQEIELLARTRGWRVIVPAADGLTLRLDGVSPETVMPSARMQILAGSLEAPEAGKWSTILSWIRDHVPQPLLVTTPNGPTNDLALWAHAALGWPHAAWIGDVFPVATPSALALITSSRGVCFSSDAARSQFLRRWPTPIRELDSLSIIEARRPEPVARVQKDDQKLRVLLVSYYAGPCPTVGVQRPNYWFQEIERLSQGQVTVDLAHGTPWLDAPPRTHWVPDLGPAEACGATLWESEILTETKRRSAIFSQDAAFWHLSLEKYFSTRNDHFDVVICSGNPFSYFTFARFAKQKWSASVILDYRDPFSLNPRINFTSDQREAAAIIESGWNLAADAITVVNTVCTQLVSTANPLTKPVVIPNGWDERVATSQRHTDSDGTTIKLVHAGQLYSISPIDALVNEVGMSSSIELHQFGQPIPNAPDAVTNHTRLPREHLLAQLGTMDCGVTFSSDRGFETPTKLFDYLSTGLDILVLFEGQREGSALDELLGDASRVHWVRNTPSAIKDWLADYQPMASQDPERAEPFTRRNATLTLIELIKRLGSHWFELNGQTWTDRPTPTLAGPTED